MGLLDRIGRAASKGASALGGFLSDVVGGALETFSDPGLIDPRGRGIAHGIGAVIGETAEVVFGSPETSVHTGRISIPTTVPGGFGPVFGPTASAGPGTSRDAIPLPPSRVTRSPSISPPQARKMGIAQDVGLGFTGPPADPSTPMGRIVSESAAGGTGRFGPPEIAERILFPTLPGPQGVQVLEEIALGIPRLIERGREFIRGFREEEEAGMPDAVALPGGAAIQTRDVPGLGTLCRGTSPFKQTMGGVRAARVFALPHPVTGEVMFFGHLGRPLLFSRDMSAARKVDRLARRARRTRRGR